MQVGILALQGDFDAHAQAVRRLGHEPVLIRSAAELADPGLAALILPGGESTTMLKSLQSEPGFLDGLRDFVRHRPTYGTCAGAILLARRVTGPAQASLGLLDLTAVRNAYGRQIDSSIRTAQVRPSFVAAVGTRELEAVLIRAPRFEELGPEVEIIAEEAGEPVLVRQGHVAASSFHPELSTDLHVHRWFLGQAALQSSR